MPCNSDYMSPNSWELELSRVACLIDEIDGETDIPEEHREGYHPDIYSMNLSKEDADKLVRKLCESLQGVDVTQYSLEMQIWWRDHQKSDKLRLEKELKEAEIDNQKEQALSKLTDYERKILGLK